MQQLLTSSLDSFHLNSINESEEELTKLERKFQEGLLDFNAATRYEKLLSVADSIREINAQLNKKNRAVNDVRQDAQEEIAIMQAELDGEKKKRRELEKQRDVRKEMQSLVKSGMNEHDALGLAEQKVSLTYKIEDKREREKKEKRIPGRGRRKYPMRLKHGLTQYSRRFQAYPVWGLVSVPSFPWWGRRVPAFPQPWTP